MEYLGEKVAYLRGLADGMKIEESSNEGRLLKGIIDVLDDFAATIADLEDSQELLSEHIESIDEDLAEVESEVYEDMEDEEFDEDYDDEEEVEYFEVECPNCHETVYLDEDMFDNEEEITCPNCKETIEIEFDCDCDCGCDHDHE